MFRIPGFRVSLNHVSDIAVEFSYENWVGKVGIDDYNQVITHCRLYEVPKDSDLIDKEVDYCIADTIAACHPFDQMDKRIGRKIALRRALQVATHKYGMTKEFRKEIWNKYFELSPKSKISI